MAQPIEQWITDIPPVTRAWVAAAVGTSLLVVSRCAASGVRRTAGGGQWVASSATEACILSLLERLGASWSFLERRGASRREVERRVEK
jgi:hypothetical protein